MAKSALNTSTDSKGKKRHNVSFSNDTKNSSNNNNVSFDTTFDTSFDENVLQYSADEKPWDGNLFDSDDPFLTDPKALDRLYSTNDDSEQRPLVSIRVQERLSILFDEVSSSPATRVIGTVHLTPFDNNATIDTFCLLLGIGEGKLNVGRNKVGFVRIYPLQHFIRLWILQTKSFAYLPNMLRH